MPLLLVAACWLLALPAAEPSTRLNVQLDPARPTQLYQAPSGDGRPGAWIITASGSRRPAGGTVGLRRPGGVLPPRRTQSAASVPAPRPVKTRPSAAAGDWTQHNRVEAAPGQQGGGKRPIKLPSFVVTSRPFGFKGSSSSGQDHRRPTTHYSSASGQSYATSGQSYSTPGQSTSGYGYTTASQSQRHPPVSSYIRPSHPRPSAAPGFSRPASGSFTPNTNLNRRPSTSHRQPSRPAGSYPSRPAAVASHGRPGPQRPASLSQTSHRPSGAIGASRPSQTSAQPNSQTPASHAGLSPGANSAQQADVKPLPALPSADGDTFTRKNAPDDVSSVGGKKLPTFNLGCRQGRRCSFIINAPSRVPQPTYTPYNKHTVNNYLQRFQTLLAMSKSKKGDDGSSTSASTSKGSSVASPSTNVPSVVAAPGVLSASSGASGDIYNSNRATAVPSPGEAYRDDIRRAAISGQKPVFTWTDSASDRSGAALVAQRYRPSTVNLYQTMRESPATLRTVKPADTATTFGSQWRQTAQWSPNTHREAKKLQNSGVNEAAKRGGSPPGQRFSRYTVERVDPKTKISYPTAWNSENQDSSNVVPVGGTIFKAHLSTGPINFQSYTGVKQSRSEGSFKRHSVDSIPGAASIITEEGVREVPNVMSREFMHRVATARQYQPTGRSRAHHHRQMARHTGHYAAPPSRPRSIWRWIQPTISSRKLHK